jgi:hypothetical protein
MQREDCRGTEGKEFIQKLASAASTIFPFLSAIRFFALGELV